MENRMALNIKLGAMWMLPGHRCYFRHAFRARSHSDVPGTQAVSADPESALATAGERGGVLARQGFDSDRAAGRNPHFHHCWLQ
jgi:hypothetical protein